MAVLKSTNITTNLSVTGNITSQGYINPEIINPASSILLSDGSTVPLMGELTQDKKMQLLLSAKVSYTYNQSMTPPATFKGLSSYVMQGLDIEIGIARQATNEWYTYIKFKNLEAINNLEVTNSPENALPALAASEALYRNQKVSIMVIDDIPITYSIPFDNYSEYTEYKNRGVDLVINTDNERVTNIVVPKITYNGFTTSLHGVSGYFDIYTDYSELKTIFLDTGGTDVIGKLPYILRFSCPTLSPASEHSSYFFPIIGSIIMFTDIDSFIPRWFASVDSSTGKIKDNRIRLYNSISQSTTFISKTSLVGTTYGLASDGKYYKVNDDFTKGTPISTGYYISKFGLRDSTTFSVIGIETYNNGSFVSRSGPPAYSFNT